MEMAWTNQYDSAFRAAATVHFGEFETDWRWFKAQACAESALDPLAISPCGARGLMQIMPATWDEIKTYLNIEDPFNPGDSIRAGAYYMRRQWDWWWSRGIQKDCMKFAQASYNAGLGNVKKAWRRTRNSDAWADVAAQLPAITGDHAIETVQYVKRIEKFYRELCDGPA
jgi:soluble lytic murein transglycosylase-like protein